LTVTSAGPPANGAVSVNPDGTIDYTPDPDFSGTDTFTYTVCDVAGNCSTATVTVTVNEVNDPPAARNDSGRAREGRTITVDNLANDSDGDNTLDPTSVKILAQPAHGTVSVNADGSVDFTAEAGYDGTDSFRYEVCDDGAPAECDTATVDLEIWLRDPNRRPDAVDDSATTPEDTPVTINVRNNDTDPDGDPLTIESFSQPKHGTVSSSGGRLVFTPDDNWHGTTTFAYTVCDPDGRCDDATVTVTVDPVDDAPVAHDDAIVVKDGKPIDIPVVDNDDEVDGEPVTVDIVDQPAHGTVTVNADGTVTYTPDEGYDGSDSFTYEICDPDGDCSEATVTVEVDGSSVPVENPPREPSAPDPEPQASELPHTGGDVTRLALWGITLLLMGATLARRRRTGLG
jgi:LPXTG-motif cell wall-anchored protein